MNKVALAWEGGGSKGAFGVGAIKALYEDLKNHWFDALAGSSVGGICGVLVIAQEIDKLYKIWQKENLEKKIYRFNGISLVKHGSLYTVKPLKNFLNQYLTEEIFEKIKNKKIYLTGINFETNELIVFSNFRNREELLKALLVTSAIPATFEIQKDERDQILVDGGLRYPLPLKVLLDQGYKNIVAIIHEPLNLEDWTNVQKIIEKKKIISLKDLFNRSIELTTRNLTYKDLEKVFLTKIFKNFLKKISSLAEEIENKEIKEKIKKEIENFKIPYDVNLVIISPPHELHGVLDFSRKSIKKALELGYKIGKEKLAEIKNLFRE
jgi:predicted acylesterase/phospholipase RssA